MELAYGWLSSYVRPSRKDIGGCFMKNKESNHDMIDEDLYEEFDEEELYALVEAERQKALKRAHHPKPKRPFPKWAFWLIAMTLVLNLLALLPQTFSIPAIDFLMTSAKLSIQEDIKAYKKAVVVIEAEDSRGTGFAISADGTILTNAHVVDGEDEVTAAFPDDGLYVADVIQTYPSIDLAVLQVEDQDLPYLPLDEKPHFNRGDSVTFIGNPLRFQGIANEGTIIDDTHLSGWDKPVVMMDAPVYRGNSGSPVISSNGQVIGVVFASLDHDTYGRVGLFVPISYYTKLHQKSSLFKE